MKTKMFRIVMVLSAFMLGSVIVVALTMVGDKSRGPIEDALVVASNAVHDVEETVIIQQREHKRSDKLDWYKPYTDNIATLKNPSTILLGAYDNMTTESFESVVSLEDSLRNTFPLIQVYTAWGSKPDEQFPKLQVESILELGSTPVITWEPWLTDFDATKIPGLRSVEERDKGGLTDIANGAYDTYIRKWATAAKQIKKPIFLRVGHEMNDPYRYPWGPQNNKATDFVLAWQHIHDVFKLAGANNVIWVWSPHPAYGFFDAFYPGDNYVDYVGVAALNYGTVASWSKWWTFNDIFGLHYADIAKFKKPIMITEMGCLSVGGNRAKWFSDALAKLPQTYPLVKSILFFHFNKDVTTTQQPIDWYFKDDALVTNAIIKEINGWPANAKAAMK